MRDENALESALARAQQKWHVGGEHDLAMLAAAYAFGLVRTHPYRDGNKRIGLLAMVTFLGLNGHDFTASDADVVSQFVALADGGVTEETRAAWIRAHVTRQR